MVSVWRHELTNDEFLGWSSDRGTREVKDYLKELRDNYTELLHNLMTNCDDANKMAVQGARLQGMIIGINNLLELEWSDIGGSEEEA